MPKLEAVIERIEITPGIFKRQPADYTSNESGVGLVSLRAEWPIILEVQGEGLDGIEEAVKRILDRFGNLAFDFTIALLDKDKQRMESEEEF